jgi:hypothetical protein
VILPTFRQRPDLHCGSTALCDALRARGLDLSEPLAFALGAGLGFHHVVAPEFTPSHFLVGGSAGLKRTACEVLGAPAAQRTAAGVMEVLGGVRADDRSGRSAPATIRIACDASGSRTR